MVDTYDQYADEMYIVPGQHGVLIEQLNKTFFQIWVPHVNANTSNERMFMQLLGDPNSQVNYPENVRKKDKSIVISEHDLMTYGDNQGVHFDVEQDSLSNLLRQNGATPTRVVIGALEDPLQNIF
jgi:hypothetical protein